MAHTQLLAGTSKVDITPNFGSPTRRWYLPDEDARISDIRWPLYARTVAICDGETITTVTSLEVACLYKCHFDHIRGLVREMSRTPVDQIILHNTHQHSDSFIEYESSYDVFGLNDVAFDLDYVRSLPRKIATSICLAVDAMSPALVGYAAGAVEEGIASCRRVIRDDGTVTWRGSRPAQHLRDLPRGHIDPEVGVVLFSSPDGTPIATIYNYACHPSAAGGDSPPVCSADYPGFASHLIETTIGGTALFLHGCSGDINPAKYIRGDSTDFDDRIADARRMGRIIGGEVIKTTARIETGEVTRLCAVGRECLLPVQSGAGDVDRALEVANDAVAKWRADGSDPRTALRKYVLSKKLVDDRCPVSMFALAMNDAVISFVPGEPFTELGERIKRSSTAGLTLVAATCGEDPFYMPTAEAVRLGGYETGYVATAETGETLVRFAGELIEAARNGTPA